MPLIEKLQQVDAEVRKHFLILSTEQLNWKPTPEKWSIAECLQHLITTDNSYFKEFNKVINGTYRPTLYTRLSPFTDFFTNWLEKNITADTKRRVKAPAIFHPARSNYNKKIVEDYLAHLLVVNEYLEKLSNEKFRNIIITTPASRLVTLHLSRIIPISIAHEERHVNQAKNLLNMDDFPK